MFERLKTRLYNAARRFTLNKAGNVAMIFGLSLIPLITAGGLAVDMSRAMVVRYRLSHALDAAGLAAGRSFGEGIDEVTAVAQRYFNANYPAAELGVPGTLQVSMEGPHINLTASAQVETTLMAIAGFDMLNVGVSSQITREGKSIEVGLALDVTGSMAGSKIADLRAAAKELVDTVVWDDQDQFYSKVALAPYSMGVNVGTYADSIRGAPPAPKTITGAMWGKTVTGATPWTGTAKNITAATVFAATARNITGVTKASNGVVTSSAHGLTTGQSVYITGVNGMTQLNNKVYTITTVNANSYRLNVSTSGYSNYSSGGSGRRCTAVGCLVQLTSSSHGFANGDTVYVSGVGGMTQINNRIFTVSGVTANTYDLVAEVGTTHSTYTSSGAGRECTNANCWVVVTSNAHGFANGNTVHIDGVGGMTQINNDNYTISGVTTNTFVLNNEVGTTHGTYTSGGQVCLTSSCPVTITSNGHGFANNDYVYITGVGGMTQLNNTAFQVSNTAANTFQLSGINGSTFSAYTSGGNIYCMTAGCTYYRFTNATGSTRIHQLSTCVTERIGGQAYTDAAPSTAFVGRNYPSTSNGCLTNQIVPLSDDKEFLKAQIDTYVAQGSTAGHVGMAWGWYMISPNFGYLWPSESQPALYGATNVVKIAVLMTDGAFNSPYCNGVIAADATSGSGSASDHINCNATNGSSYSQAEDVCDAIKDEEIEIYTVGFDIGDQQQAIDVMANCASDDEHAYLAESGAELMAIFQNIAANISSLRLSQ